MLPEGYTENAILLVMSLCLPLAGAILLPFFKRHAALRDAIAITLSLSLFVLICQLVDLYLEGARPRMQLWQLFPGFSIILSLRPLGILFAATASLLWVATTFYSIGYLKKNKEKNQTRFHICFTLSIAATMGIAFSDNLFSLFLFYEMLTLLTYPLVVHKGDKASVRGARSYLAILMFTSLVFFLPAMLITWNLTGTLNFTRGGVMEDLLTPGQTGLLLALFVFGVAKAALMPVHRWLPAAMVAPAPVSALLHAVAVVKAGVFTLLMVIVYLFGFDSLHRLTQRDWSTAGWLVYVAGFTIVVASLTALRRDNLKQRLAYSTISQLAYVILGAAVLAPLSLVGAALHIIAHAFSKITLFYAAGALYVTGKKSYVSELDGIGRAMPWTMGAFTLAALSLIGVPPTLGFLSKWYILLGAMQQEQYFALAVIVISTLLNAAYLLPVIQRAYFREPQTPIRHREAPKAMVAAMIFTSAMTVILFFASGWILAIASEMLTVWEPLHLP